MLSFHRYYNGYVESKREAEQLVLQESGRHSLVTVALRPAHIYGPGDFMITTILDARKAGEVPFAFGKGCSDYIYVDNCAIAHVDCLSTLLRHPRGGKSIVMRKSGAGPPIPPAQLGLVFYPM